jgi:hypothetical protein
MVKLVAASAVWVLTILSLGCQAQPRGDTGARGGARPQDQLFVRAPGAPLSVGGRISDIALGDWNRDGKLDAVICNDGDAVNVLLGNGRGGFTPAPGSPMKVAAHLVAAGDVNNDRNPDLALTHHDSFDVNVLLGAGDGRFSPAPGSPFAAHRSNGPHNHGLSLADVNADGRPDAVTSNQDDNSVSVLLGDGRGGFAPAPGSPFAVGRAPYPHAVADLNGDARPDIVTPNVGGGSVSVMLGDGRGGFVPAANSPYAVAPRPFYVASGDVSGDGRPDLVMTHDDSNLLTTLLGDGRGGFAAAPASPFDFGRRAYRLVAADVNRDARADLVVGTEGGNSVFVLLGDARGAYTQAAGSPYPAGRSPRVAVGDVNGDGRADIVAADHESGGISVLLGR